MDALAWLQQWYKSQCDGEWEFRQGIKILSVSNPGWSVEIDVSDTVLEDVSIEPRGHNKTPDDWYGFVLEDGLFVGSGDSSKLEFIILAFKGLLEGKELP
ncbi:immunity 53 family protein [Hymenobacter sp. 102]|uniref:immunity 53 family protein n=1 Tax=Hymenobacter sp. 102 TaxID=3403152 RepID=UPI003CE962D0